MPDELTEQDARDLRYAGREMHRHGVNFDLIPRYNPTLQGKRLLYLLRWGGGRNACYRLGLLSEWFEMFGKEGAD